MVTASDLLHSVRAAQSAGCSFLAQPENGPLPARLAAVAELEERVRRVSEGLAQFRGIADEPLRQEWRAYTGLLERLGPRLRDFGARLQARRAHLQLLQNHLGAVHTWADTLRQTTP